MVKWRNLELGEELKSRIRIESSLGIVRNYKEIVFIYLEHLYLFNIVEKIRLLVNEFSSITSIFFHFLMKPKFCFGEIYRITYYSISVSDLFVCYSLNFTMI